MLILLEDFLNKAEQKLAEQSRILLNGYLHDKVSLCLADSVELLAETIQTVEGARQEETQELMAFALDYFELIDIPIGAYNKVRNEIIGSSNNGYSIPIPLAHINQEELEAYVTSFVPVGSNVVNVDTPANWSDTDKVIPLGQLGYAYDASGLVTEARLGVGKPWTQSPLIYSGFIPIVTTSGRDMNNPGGARVPLNIQTEREAWKYVLEPYSPPSLALSYITGYGGAFPVLEVGDTFNSTSQTFGITISNIDSILEEGGTRYVYVDGVPRILAADPDNDGIVVQVITKAINVTSNKDASIPVLQVYVKRKDDGQPTAILRVNMDFQYNSGFFLHPIGENLIDASEDRINEVVQTVISQGDRAKVSEVGIERNGGHAFGYVTLDTDAIDGKLYHIYIYSPVERGKPSIAAASSSTAKVDVLSKDFTYKYANAEIPYTLTRMESAIQGEYPAYIQ